MRNIHFDKNLGTKLNNFCQTSLDKTGSDGMNKGPDYSAAYCILQTNSEDSGHGMVSPDAHESRQADVKKVSNT